MQTQIEIQKQIKMQKKREMRKQSDMRRNIFIEKSMEAVESILKKEKKFKNDHKFVAHCHRNIALIKKNKTLNLLRGLHLDITNKLLGYNVSHERVGIYNYPAYQDNQNL